jgi:hypothetical protein
VVFLSSRGVLSLSFVSANWGLRRNATARLMTVYELSGPVTSKAVRDRCLAYLEAVNSEIETEIRKASPFLPSASPDEGRGLA